MPCLNRFAVLETVDSVEGTWSNFRNTVVQAAEKVVGYRRGTRKERWISDDTRKVIDERKRIKQWKSQGQLTKEQLADLEQEYRVKDKEVKRRCMKDKQQWYDSKVGEAKKAAIAGDHKTVYRIVKELTGQQKQSQQVKMTNGKFARIHDKLVKRWQEHFQSVLNCRSLQ